jgi:hypothetical protein
MSRSRLWLNSPGTEDLDQDSVFAATFAAFRATSLRFKPESPIGAGGGRFRIYVDVAGDVRVVTAWCPDALFELADAVLAAPGPVASLPYLTLEPAFRRGHGMTCQALADGGIDEEAVRDLLVAARPRDWPLVFAIDASTYPRPEAECSPEREFHHHSCAGFHSGDGAAIAGWAFQWLAQLSFAHDSRGRAAGPGPRRGQGRRDPAGSGTGHRALGPAAGGRPGRHPRCTCWTPATTRPRCSSKSVTAATPGAALAEAGT